jgi:hypothetical protein
VKAIVITRDRVSYAKQTAYALVRQRFDVHIVDHGSSWGPMLDWLHWTELPVTRVGDATPRELWGRLRSATLEQIVGFSERYVVCDPDVVPSAGCDARWLTLAHEVLDNEPHIVKCGPGLQVDDLPFNVFTDRVKEWERQFWVREIAHGVWSAPIDTTPALYRPLDEVPDFCLGPGARLGPPFTFRHLPWYEVELTPEITWYRAHVLEGASHWEPQR